MNWVSFVLLGVVALVSSQERSFIIDYEGDQFLMDGQPFRYISGCLHYFRTPASTWRDRLQKLRAAGLNAVQTYVEWSFHEPWRGVYDFDGDQDIVQFIQIAQEEGLYVILRPGPYINAERDLGGFPFWLLQEDSSMTLRSSEEVFMGFVETWLRELSSRMVPLMYHNGGPIIMVQIENEYGSYFTCDFDYTRRLLEIQREVLGEQTLFFTTDNTGSIMCGKVADAYATIYFGPGFTDVMDTFHYMRNFEPRGPLVNSEFLAGWLDHWGENHSTRTTESVTSALDAILAVNASVTIFLLLGGTNFGFTAGANLGDFYMPVPTSYDFDSLLTEAGDPTEKYYAVRDVIGRYVDLPPGPVPEPAPKGDYGNVALNAAGSLFDALGTLSLSPTDSDSPVTFEWLGVNGGLVIYETTITQQPTDPALLTVTGIKDRAYVFVDQEYFGILSRSYEVYSIPIVAQVGQKLQIVVENQGHVTFGNDIDDFKGILSDVTLNNYRLDGWTQYPIPLNDTDLLHKYVAQKSTTPQTINRAFAHPNAPMSFYTGEFVISGDQPLDTFLNLGNWQKGVAFINGHNIGRYWPKEGPQQTLYVPASFLVGQSETNRITLLEYQRSPCVTAPENCFVSFVTDPVVNGPTPTWPANVKERKIPERRRGFH